MDCSDAPENSDTSPISSSSSSGDENIIIAGSTHPTYLNIDPESPNAAQQSSDESGSSDGVLVELPCNIDQDSRSLPGDPDGDILVNIDGSIQERQEREDLLIDASDRLGRILKIGGSAAMAEVGDTSLGKSIEHDPESVQAQLDALSAECNKYKEERETFGRVVVTLYSELFDLIDHKDFESEMRLEHRQLLENRETEHDIRPSFASLNSMLKDCSRFLVQFKGALDDFLNAKSSVLYSKDHEIEILNEKILENNICRDILTAYLCSVGGECSHSIHEYTNVIKDRLTVSLIPIMAGIEGASSEEHDVDGISMIEKRIMLLVEKHNQHLYEVKQLGQFIDDMKPGSLATQEDNFRLVVTVARDVLLESKEKKEELEAKISEVEDENMKMSEQIANLNTVREETNIEMSKIKTELEQAEIRYMAAKEKLSIAVAKGKQLVQHRDSLKLSLANKTTELDRCLQELQEKANVLEMLEAGNEEMKLLLSAKISGLENCLSESQIKSDKISIFEATIEDQKLLFEEKTSELEKCLQELQLKSDALKMANINAEKCLLSAKKKEEDLEISEATVHQLKQSLYEKAIELENSMFELQEKSLLMETANAVSKEFDETQKKIRSMEEAASHRDKIMKDIEDAVHEVDFSQDLLSLDTVDKVRWLTSNIRLSNEALLVNRRAQIALNSVGLPDAILSSELDIQVDWLIKLFTQCNDALCELRSEVTQISVLHELEMSEAIKEFDNIVESLLKEEVEKEFLLIECEILKVYHQKLAKNFRLISSEKERFIEFLKVIITTNLDDKMHFDVDTMLEKSITLLKKMMKNSSNDGNKLERMQTLLYVTHADLVLFEKILEELLMDRSKLISLSFELEITSKDVYALRSENASMKKELEQLAEKNLLIRDKLSMAVKKGKGLVQEREGLKLTLSDKNSQIEKLKEELLLLESKIYDYREQIKHLASLNCKGKENEHLLNESNEKLKKIVDFINGIVTHTDKIFESPLEKVEWIIRHIDEIENTKVCLEQELEKVKVDATLNFNRLVETLETMKSFETELHNKEKHIHDIFEEKNNFQATKIKTDEELEKTKEDTFILANKLSDAYVAMKTMEDALLLAEGKVTKLDAEKSEIVSRSNMEIFALKHKAAECMVELTKTRNKSENQFSDLLSELKQLKVFMKNEGLIPLTVEQFLKETERLRHMWMLLQEIHNNFVAKGSHIHHEMEQDTAFSNLSFLTSLEDFINNEEFHSEDLSHDADVPTACKKIVENIYENANLLNDRFRWFSTHMDDHITFALQILQTARDEFITTINLRESLKLNIEKLESQNQAQMLEISSLQSDSMRLLSTCSDATQELLVTISDLLDFDSDLNEVQGIVDRKDANEFALASDKLLLSCRKVILQSKNLEKTNTNLSLSIEILNDKLRQTERIVETATDERKLSQEKVIELERERDALQTFCNEMKTKLSTYKSKEDMIYDKEAELKRLEHSLAAKVTGAVDEMRSKEQLKSIFDKVNELIVLADSESHGKEVQFSSPIEKLIYVVDKFTEYQKGVFLLSSEKDDLKLLLANHVCEIERLKSSTEALSADYQDFELRKHEISEVMAIVEKILQKFKVNYSFEDLNSVTVLQLIHVLESQMSTLSVDLDKSKSKVHELGGKLQANNAIINELSTKLKYYEDLHLRIHQPDVEERDLFESSSAMMRPEITEIEEGSVGMSTKPPSSSAFAHARTTRKGSSDHLILNIDSESKHLITTHESIDKGHVFKSLNSSGLIPKQGKLFADRVDGIWVSGGRMLMSKPGARLSLISYWIFLHLWLLGSLLL